MRGNDARADRCARKQPASLQMDPVLEALIPADTTVLLGANIESIKDPEVYHKLLTQLSLPQLNEFTQRTGLDRAQGSLAGDFRIQQ